MLSRPAIEDNGGSGGIGGDGERGVLFGGAKSRTRQSESEQGVQNERQMNLIFYAIHLYHNILF